MMFGVEKLEWFGYPMVKNFEDAITHSMIKKCSQGSIPIVKRFLGENRNF